MHIKTYAMVFASLMTLAFAVGASEIFASFNQSSNSLRLDVVTDKESYLVGELINLKFKILNQSERQISLYPGSTVWDGYIGVFLAYQGEDFKRYRGPEWGLRDVYYKENLLLNPGESFESDATMLCNPILQTGHLNEVAAQRARERENLVQGNYVLSRPGFYFVKAILRDPKTRDIVESTPIRIVAEMPQGDDLEVWNKIRGRRDYAYFIQTGSLGVPTDESTKKVAEQLEGIVRIHPTSKYARQMRKGLNEHRAVVDKLSKDEPPTRRN